MFDEAKPGKLDSALTLLVGYIGSETGYVAGEHITIADHCLIATVSTMVVSIQHPEKQVSLNLIIYVT